MTIFHETGTATNYKDLLQKLAVAATTNLAMTTAGIAWQPERSTFVIDTSRTPQLFVGASDKGGTKGNFLAATVDELAIYNSELSAGQVSTNFGLISAGNGANYRTAISAIAINYYRLDEVSGATITDYQAATNGAYVGTVSYSQTGIFGAGGGDANNNAVSLDGSTAYLDFASAFTAGFGSQARTVEFSFKTVADGCLLCLKQNAEWYGLFIESGNLIFRSSILQNEGAITVASSVATGAYKHLVFARTSDGAFKVYLDGSLVHTYSVATHEVALKGVGNGGLDEIYIGMQTEENVSSGWYNWRLNGYSGYVRTGDFFTQPTALPNNQYLPALLLWNTTIPYDFMVSARRIIVSARVSTNDEMMYLGLLKTYGLPGEHPYPMVVGGNCFKGNIYSLNSEGHTNFFNHIDDDIYTGYSPVLINLAGWKYIYNAGNANVDNFSAPPQILTDPYVNYACSQQLLYVQDTENKPLRPVELLKHKSDIYGLFEDCYWTAYTNQSSGDTITEGGSDYKVFQNVNRNGRNDFVAVRIS